MAGPAVGERRRPVLAELDLVEPHGDAAAVGHRVARVDDEVHHALLDLSRVGDDDERPGGDDDLEIDLRSDQPAQHRVHAAYDVGEREAARPRRLPAAEREQLPREPRAAIDRLLDFHRLVARRVARGELHEQEVGGAHDAHEDVVEIVRHAAGEPSDRLELLRLAELFLERAPLGDVADEPREHRAGVDADARDGQFDGELGAVGAAAAQLHLAARERAASRRQVFVERAQLLATIGRRQQHLDVAAEHAEAGVAEHLLRGGVELADVQRVIHRDDRVVRRLENRALARFALAAGAVHLVGEIQRRRGEEQRQPVARRLGHLDDDGRGRRAEQIARRARREVALPDPPGVLIRRQRDRDRDRHRVDEEVGERHAGERHDERRGIGVGPAAEPLEHLAGRLHGEHQDRHVEQRAERRVRRPRVQRRLTPSAGGANDHRRVRAAENQRRDVDDVRHRHVRAAGDRKLHLEGRGQRRQ